MKYNINGVDDDDDDDVDDDVDYDDDDDVDYDDDDDDGGHDDDDDYEEAVDDEIGDDDCSCVLAFLILTGSLTSNEPPAFGKKGGNLRKVAENPSPRSHTRTMSNLRQPSPTPSLTLHNYLAVCVLHKANQQCPPAASCGSLT